MQLRNRIIAGAAPWMASEDATQGEPATTERAVLADGLLGILRAGRCVATGGRKQGRDTTAVEGYQPKHGLTE